MRIGGQLFIERNGIRLPAVDQAEERGGGADDEGVPHQRDRPRFRKERRVHGDVRRREVQPNRRSGSIPADRSDTTRMKAIDDYGQCRSQIGVRRRLVHIPALDALDQYVVQVQAGAAVDLAVEDAERERSRGRSVRLDLRQRLLVKDQRFDRRDGAERYGER